MRESTLRELTLRLKNAAPTLQLEENADMLYDAAFGRPGGFDGKSGRPSANSAAD